MKRYFIIILLINILNSSIVQATDKEDLASDIIEFALVLLPSEQQSCDVRELSSRALNTLLKKQGENKERNCNTLLTIPHISLGQYASAKNEIKELKRIVDEMSTDLITVTEFMIGKLNVTEENIFFNCVNQEKTVNPVLKKIYMDFRSKYMERIKSRRPIRQALQAEKENQDNPEELALLKDCYQNWGTPEKDRINPHFTLVYNYKDKKSEVEDKIISIEIPDSLKQVKFTHLALLAIDYWGNPLPDGILYAVTLK